MSTLGRVAGLMGSAKQIASNATEKVNSSSAKISDEYKIGEKFDDVRRRLDDNTPDFVKDTTVRVIESVDVVTGNKLLQTVQEMVDLQEQYNDILAAKLEEALTRIAILESALSISGEKI